MPSYFIDDPRPIREANPYTFFLPDEDMIGSVKPDMHVQLMFQPSSPDQSHGGERMWVKVTERSGDQIKGLLDNDPAYFQDLKWGDEITFEAHHIISVLSPQAEQSKGQGSEQKEYWDRCFVDTAILERRARVGFIYREKPLESDGERFPDSGWRIRADSNQITPEEFASDNYQYVALAAVLNRDDSFLDLLDAPEGASYQRGEGDNYENQAPEILI